MSEKRLSFVYEEFASVSEMMPEDQELVAAALDAQNGSYSPYLYVFVAQ